MLRSKSEPAFTFSDSQAAIKALGDLTMNFQLVLDSRRSLQEMNKQIRLSLTWVPGHGDIEGNCKADELARKVATQQILLAKELFVTCKLLLIEFIYKQTAARWNDTTTARKNRGVPIEVVRIIRKRKRSSIFYVTVLL